MRMKNWKGLTFFLVIFIFSMFFDCLDDMLGTNAINMPEPMAQMGVQTMTRGSASYGYLSVGTEFGADAYAGWAEHRLPTHLFEELDLDRGQVFNRIIEKKLFPWPSSSPFWFDPLNPFSTINLTLFGSSMIGAVSGYLDMGRGYMNWYGEQGSSFGIFGSSNPFYHQIPSYPIYDVGGYGLPEIPKAPYLGSPYQTTY